MTDMEHCPMCGEDVTYWVNGVGPYYRITGVEVRGVYDGVLYWMHDCGKAWQRWPEGHRLHSIAALYIAAVNEGKDPFEDNPTV